MDHRRVENKVNFGAHAITKWPNGSHVGVLVDAAPNE